MASEPGERPPAKGFPPPPPPRLPTPSPSGGGRSSAPDQPPAAPASPPRRPGPVAPLGPPSRPAGPPPPASWPNGPPVPPVGGQPIAPINPPPQSGGRWLVIAGTVAAVAIGAVVTFLVLGGDDDDEPAATGPNGSVDAGSTTSGDVAAASASATVVTVPAVTIPLPSVGLSPTVPSIAQASGELPPGQPPSELGNDSALDTLAEACYSGDMSECDNLFLQSAFGSDYQTYGDTCAGRQPAGTGQLCSAVFASAVSATTNG